MLPLRARLSEGEENEPLLGDTMALLPLVVVDMLPLRLRDTGGRSLYDKWLICIRRAVI